MGRNDGILCAFAIEADDRHRTHVSLAVVASYSPGSEGRVSLNAMQSTEGLGISPLPI